MNNFNKEEDAIYYGSDENTNFNIFLNNINNDNKEIESIPKITEDSIIKLFEDKNKCWLYSDTIGQIDFNTIVVRKYNLNFENNELYFIKMLKILSTITHPAIQIFYGMLNESNNEEIKDIKIVLEYISSSLEEVLYFANNYLEENNRLNILYLIICKLSEILSFIYNSNFCYLGLNPDSLKFNNKLFKQYYKIDEDNNSSFILNQNYLSKPSKIFENNFMKLINIGDFYKYIYPINDKANYSIYDIDFKNYVFYSKEFLAILKNKNVLKEEDFKIYEKWDIYSFGCLLFFIFYRKVPYFYYFEQNTSKEIIIQAINNENDFLMTQESHLKNEENIYKNVPNFIKEMIKKCTNKDSELRPNFNNIFEDINQYLHNIYKDKNKEENENSSSYKKNLFHDFSFYQLSNYNESLYIIKEMIKNKRLNEELERLNEEYENEKNKFINSYHKILDK